MVEEKSLSSWFVIMLDVKDNIIPIEKYSKEVSRLGKIEHHFCMVHYSILLFLIKSNPHFIEIIWTFLNNRNRIKTRVFKREIRRWNNFAKIKSCLSSYFSSSIISFFSDSSVSFLYSSKNTVFVRVQKMIVIIISLDNQNTTYIFDKFSLNQGDENILSETHT